MSKQSLPSAAGKGVVPVVLALLFHLLTAAVLVFVVGGFWWTVRAVGPYEWPGPQQAIYDDALHDAQVVSCLAAGAVTVGAVLGWLAGWSWPARKRWALTAAGMLILTVLLLGGLIIWWETQREGRTY
jgi:hypothetical protein